MAKSSLSLSHKRKLSAFTAGLLSLAVIVTGGFLLSQNQIGNANATSGTPIYSDNFGSTLDGSWVKMAPSAFTATTDNGKLVLKNGNLYGFTGQHLLRPMSEAVINQYASIEIPAGFSLGQVPVLAVRQQGTTERAYLAVMNTNTTHRTLFIYAADGSVASPGVMVASYTYPADFNTTHSYRLSLSAIGTSPTKLTASLEDLTTGESQTINGTHNAVGTPLESAGTAGVGYNALLSENPGPFTSISFDNFVFTTAEAPLVIPYNHPDLVYSNYNWFDTGSYIESTAAGAYVKVAFTGTQRLGLEVDTPVASGNIKVYVDGSSTPVVFNIPAGGYTGELVVSDTLDPNATHYATIYYSMRSGAADRWINGNTASLRLVGLTVDNGASILPVGTTPIAENTEKLLFYGDSITDGMSNQNGADVNYASQLGRSLGTNYSTVGYSGIGWNIASAPVPAFYTNTPSIDVWSNYFASQSRLSAGSYIGGAPTAIFNNLGVNDVLYSSGADTMRSKIVSWLGDARAASSADTDIYLIEPFNYGCSDSLLSYNNATYPYSTYRAAYEGAYADYMTAHPTDKVYLVKLGELACNTVLNNGTDKLHPNAAGSAILADLIEDALTPLAPSGISTAATGNPDEIALSWTAPTADANGIDHVFDGYLVQYRENGTSTWTDFATVGRATTSVDIDNLIGGIRYDFRVTTIGTGLVADAPYAEIDDIPESDPNLSAAWTTNGETHELETTTPLEYTVQKDFRLFSSASVDGLVISAGADYTVANGSTVVTLRAGYLNGLAVGDHTLTVAFSDGVSATGTFRVLAAVGGGNNGGSNGGGSVGAPVVPGVPNTGVFGKVVTPY